MYLVFEKRHDLTMQDALRKHECNLKWHHVHACTIMIHTLYKNYKLKRIIIVIRDQTNILYYIGMEKPADMQIRISYYIIICMHAYT